MEAETITSVEDALIYYGANAEYGSIASIRQLAEYAGVSDRSVNKVLKEFKQEGRLRQEFTDPGKGVIRYFN